MKKQYLITAIFTLALVSCSSSQPNNANATNCATVVQNYLGITNPIAINKYSEQPETKEVEIEYQSQNDENIPINGTAACIFQTDEEGKVTLLDATIDGQQLTEADLTALNQQIKFSP